MGAGLVTEAKTTAPPSWRLKAPDDVQTQGVVVSGFSNLPYGQALFLNFNWDAPGGKKGWLTALRQVATITDADGKDSPCAAIAFTWTGLQKLGLSPEALASFSAPFKEGMYQEDRARRLGDRIDGAWQPTVVKDGPLWSGNTPTRDADADAKPVVTKKTVHALLALYSDNANQLATWAAQVAKALGPYDVEIAHQLALDLQQNNGIAREHFGFADGLSQPIPFGESVVLSNGQPLNKDNKDKWHGVPLGEILLGHPNVHHEAAPGPVVKDDTIAKKANLPIDGAPVGFRNFGYNGSYVVVRELRQDVAAFWNSVKDAAAKIQGKAPNTAPITASWLAERIIGRNIDGHLLRPNGVLPPDQFGMPDNNFEFFDSDRYGLGCPLGSHVRRSNPRDGLAKDAGSKQTLLDAANNHRILRRGRKFGPPPTDKDRKDDVDRGLLFICLNTDIARQFEFVQQTWLLNQSFATLFEETDPVLGPAGNFTIPSDPLRRIVSVATFVQMAGGEYFFLPSIPALDYLAAL